MRLACGTPVHYDHNEPLSNFAFTFNLRHYPKDDIDTLLLESAKVYEAGGSTFMINTRRLWSLKH
jgi:hypothetical protein